MKYEIRVELEEVCGIAVFDENMTDAKIKGQVSCVVGLSRNKCGVMSLPSLPLRERKRQVDSHIGFRALWHRNSDPLTLETKLNNYKQKTFEVAVMLSRGSEQILVGIASLKFTSTVFETEINIPIHLIGSSKAVQINHCSKTRGQKRLLGKEDERDSFFQSNPYTINDGIRTVCFRGGDSRRKYSLSKRAFIKLKCSCLPKQKVNLIQFQSLINENYWYRVDTVSPTPSNELSQKREREIIDRVNGAAERNSEESIEPPTILSERSIISESRTIDVNNLVMLGSHTMESIPEEGASEEGESISQQTPKPGSNLPKSEYNVWNNLIFSINNFGKHVGQELQIKRIRVEKLYFSFSHLGCIEAFGHKHQREDTPQVPTRRQTTLKRTRKPPKGMGSIPSMIDVMDGNSIDISEIQVSLFAAAIQKTTLTSSDANSGEEMQEINSEKTNQDARQRSSNITENQGRILGVAIKSKPTSLSIGTRTKPSEHIKENCPEQNQDVETPGTTALYISNMKNANASDKIIPSTPESAHKASRDKIIPSTPESAHTAASDKIIPSTPESVRTASPEQNEDLENQPSFGTTALGSLLGVDITELKKSSDVRSSSNDAGIKISLDTYKINGTTDSRKAPGNDSLLDLSLCETSSSKGSASRVEVSRHDTSTRSMIGSENSENDVSASTFATTPTSWGKTQTTSSYTAHTSYTSAADDRGRSSVDTSTILSATSRTNYGPIL